MIHFCDVSMFFNEYVLLLKSEISIHSEGKENNHLIQKLKLSSQCFQKYISSLMLPPSPLSSYIIKASGLHHHWALCLKQTVISKIFCILLCFISEYFHTFLLSETWLFLKYTAFPEALLSRCFPFYIPSYHWTQRCSKCTFVFSVAFPTHSISLLPKNSQF